MFCNIFKDPVQCTHAKRFVTGNGKIMDLPVNNC